MVGHMSVHSRNSLACVDNHHSIGCISISSLLLVLKFVPRNVESQTQARIRSWSPPRGCLWTTKHRQIHMCMHASAKAERGRCELFERIPGIYLYCMYITYRYVYKYSYIQYIRSTIHTLSNRPNRIFREHGGFIQTQRRTLTNKARAKLSSSPYAPDLNRTMLSRKFLVTTFGTRVSSWQGDPEVLVLPFGFWQRLQTVEIRNLIDSSNASTKLQVPHSNNH